MIATDLFQEGLVRRIQQIPTRSNTSLNVLSLVVQRRSLEDLSPIRLRSGCWGQENQAMHALK